MGLFDSLPHRKGLIPISKKPKPSVAAEKIDRIQKSENPLIRYAYDLVRIYLDRHISRSAAALSYYLIFTFFPVLILMNAILGLMNLDPDAVFVQLELFLPGAVASLVSDYLSYINQNNSLALLIASAALILTAASAAFRLVVRCSYDIYQLEKGISWVYYVISAFMPFIMTVVIYLSGIIMLSGNWFFRLLEKYIHLSIQILHWEWMRFLLLFLILFLFLALVYRVTLPKQEPRPPVLAGAFGASVAFVIVSILFSNVMGASSKYSVVYGSLASLIILMLWLYVIATILLMGNAFNYAIYQNHTLKNGSDED